METQRPRSKSTFSFKSHKSEKSHKSTGSGGHNNLTESAAERTAHHLNTKADPSVAISEQEPSVMAHTKSNLESLRNYQYKDANGNPIAEPDRSNPTRSRWERPLDTIRSFEAAIYGPGYSSSSRDKVGRSESFDAFSGGPSSRRGSYYQGVNNNGSGRFPQDRTGPAGPDFVDGYASPSPNQSGQAGRNRYGQRMHSDTMLNRYSNGPGVYPTHNYQQSHDTVNTGASTGSHATDQWGNSTDPSSENSSMDKMQQPAKADLGEEYGFNGFGGEPQLAGQGNGNPAYGPAGYAGPGAQAPPGAEYGFPAGNGVPPYMPPQGMPNGAAPQRPVIKLGGDSDYSASTATPTAPTIPAEKRPEIGGKRKSWLKKRFSKS
ncbi:MAG: hypothetical protein M1819_002808 [Sarea resinae]|nr:MAG: hypothetical protein M1819_002808 [Sarea resinae]